MSEPSRHLVPSTEVSASIAKADSLHARLRLATAAPHERLDRGLHYILSSTVSTERYANLLGALFGFYRPLEEYLSDQEAVSAPLGLPLIRRAGLLERDLGALGRSPEQMPRCIALPLLPTVNHLAGAIYVVEGACLGGQVIARAVMQRLRITPESGAAFFNGAGAQTGARWKQVLAWLEQRDRGAGVRDDITAGACQTFAALSHWLMTQQVLND